MPYKTSWKIIEEKYRKTILTNKLSIYIIELEKITKLTSDNSELLDWLFFLVNPKCERVVEKMKNNKELREANEKLEEILSDEDMQRIEDLKLKAILDENTAKHEAFNDGVKEGIKQGMEEGMERGVKQGIEQGLKEGVKQGSNDAIHKVAINMLKNGDSFSYIHQITNLPINQIKKLKAI